MIPNGVDLSVGRARTEPPWAGQVAPGRKVLLHLGRLHPKKGLPSLLRALNLLRRRRAGWTDQWSLVIVGWDQGGHLDKLRQFTREANLGETVHLLGAQFDEAKRAAFLGADAFILPSLSEGLPMAVLEAWAHGLPVLMTPQCNLPEGFSRGAALKISPRADDIARGLDALGAMTDEQRSRMGQAGRQLVEERFSWPQIGTELRKVYEWMLGGASRPNSVEMN